MHSRILWAVLHLSSEAAACAAAMLASCLCFLVSAVLITSAELHQLKQQLLSVPAAALLCMALSCRPCKGVGKPYEKLAAKYAKSAVFLKLFGNANAGCKRLFKSFKIRSTPSFLYYRAGARPLHISCHQGCHC
jgi:hypothetical protein